MARNIRTKSDSGFYHLFNRGSKRWPIYQDDHDRRLFVRLLAQESTAFSVQVHGYCLMGNHYHLVVRSTGPLSEMMARLSQNYTRSFNNRHSVDGPLFRGRFGSVPINSDAQLIQTMIYVARNPIDLGVKETELQNYKWSSNKVYSGQQASPDWLESNFVNDLIGDRLSTLWQAEPSPTPEYLLSYGV